MSPRLHRRVAGWGSINDVRNKLREMSIVSVFYDLFIIVEVEKTAPKV